jgi:hypothetical protein
MRRQHLHELLGTAAARADHPHLEGHRGERISEGKRGKIERMKMMTSGPHKEDKRAPQTAKW